MNTIPKFFREADEVGGAHRIGDDVPERNLPQPQQHISHFMSRADRGGYNDLHLLAELKYANLKLDYLKTVQGMVDFFTEYIREGGEIDNSYCERKLTELKAIQEKLL